MVGGVALAAWGGFAIFDLRSWLGLSLLLGGWLGNRWYARALADWLDRARDKPDALPPRLDDTRRETAERVQRLIRKQRREIEKIEADLHNLRSALQASPNGVVILNEQQCIEWCNRTACEHFGLDSNRDILQRLTNLLRAPMLVKSLEERNFSEAVILESPLSKASHPLCLEARFFPYGQGRLLMLSRDITAIEQAEAMRRDFVANVSHEICTPLTVLAGFIETLQHLSVSEGERQDYLVRMASQAARMASLVDDLLMLSRLEGGEPPDAKQWTDAQNLFMRIEADANALSAHMAGQNAPGHNLVFTGMDTAVEIAGAAKELQSAFFNLVNNAIRYTPPGGDVIVSWLVKPDGSADFSVRDNGPGIAPEHVLRLTERFYRVDSDRSRASGGTGLGLSIVKHILKRHEATLAIASVPGQGASFTASFPAHRIRLAEAEEVAYNNHL